MKETELADLISYSIGGPLVKSPVTGFSTSTPLIKDRANLLVVVDGIGKDALSKVSELKLFKQSGTKMTVEAEYFPSDSVASLTSMLTGFGPSFHGVVNKEWLNGEKSVTAYSTSTSVPQILSIGDIVSQSFGGQPLTVSASNCPVLSSALNSNEFGNSELTKNRIAISYSSETASYSSNVDSIKFELNSLLNQLSNRRFNLRNKQDRVSVDLTNSVVSVEFTSENLIAHFDLTTESDKLFFTELEMIQSVLSTIQSKYPELVEDAIPDLFSFALSSISKLQDSNKISAALLLLDSVLSDLIAQYNNIYDRMSVQIVFMGTSSVKQVQNVMKNSNYIEQVYNAIKGNIVGDKNTYLRLFPLVYVKNEQSVVNTLNNLHLNTYNNYLTATCMSNPSQLGQVKVLSATNVYGTSADYEDAAIFHIVLWGSIVLVLAVFAAIFAIYAMDTGSTDTLLYRTAAPSSGPKAPPARQ